MNINNIFSLFSQETPEGEGNNTTIDITQTPLYWVGMYKKIILNHNNFSNGLINDLKHTKNIDLNDIKLAGDFILYNRAWYYIKNIDLGIESHIDSIKYHNDKVFLKILKNSIKYFEDCEEYEKCAHLKKILNISESLLDGSESILNDLAL